MNTSLTEAKRAKNDEFYTRFEDVTHQMQFYMDWDITQFQGKTVLLPADDPEWSAFTKFFALKFEELGLKQLIATSYNPGGRGKLFRIDGDTNSDGIVDPDDLEWTNLEGAGDFRSDEVTALRDESDIIVTNPPFSLFREFLDWIMDADKKFLAIGSINAVHYKGIWPYLASGQAWLGPGSGPKQYRILDDAPKAANQTMKNGVRYQSLGNTKWFTNLDHAQRYEKLEMSTMADNLRHSEERLRKKNGYVKYANFDAIEVPEFIYIPSDYDGVMAVPDTAFGNINSDQFEILGISQSWDNTHDLRTRVFNRQTQVTKTGAVKENVTKLNDAPAIAVDTAPVSTTHYFVDDEVFVSKYVRIFIRRR